MGQTSVARFLTKISERGRKSKGEHIGMNSDQSSSSSMSLRTARHPLRLHALMSHLSESDIKRLCQEAQDYQIAHGGLLKLVSPTHGELQPFATAHTVGVTLHPSPFPAALFKEACDIQTLFQKLYVAVAKDAEFVAEALKDAILTDSLTEKLWSVHETSRASRTAAGGISAGLFRSDYMLHASTDGVLQLKQVEMNTISCAGAAHGQRTTSMHRHFHDTGLYRRMIKRQQDMLDPGSDLHIPRAENIKGICTTLQIAHHAYMRRHCGPKLDDVRKMCILMVVQPQNFNVADERPIEYGLWALEPSIPCFRVKWGTKMLECTTLTPSGGLMFHATHLAEIYEVSVVYYRAGFEDQEYTGEHASTGLEARQRFEISRAVKCPDILTHLVGSKKIQQALGEDGVLEQFIPHDEAQRLRRCFMRMYSLDDTELGCEGRTLATSPETARQYVLKPSREGGGHNHYREDMVSFLQSTPQSSWPEYIVMELIDPVVSRNVLSSRRGIWSGDTVAEVGIWGGCVWEHRDGEVDMIANSQTGWSVRSKNPGVDEMSVVKGYGCFDSLALVDDVSIKTE